MAKLLKGVDGIVDLGFQPPDALSRIMKDSTAFVLPSVYEPWGVALAEAMGSGLPAIATNACGAARDLLCDYWNGRVVPSNDARSLADAMVWLHDNQKGFSRLSANAKLKADAYSSKMWAIRWNSLIRRLATSK
jgi:glycosyltransferase involved in cell wall biosynthesis